MKGSASRLALALAMVCLLCLVRPASAQTTEDFAAARQLILNAVNAGQFKCFRMSVDLLGFLSIAEANTGARRRQALTFARDCACVLSREVQFAGNVPFTTLGTGIQDLALAPHTTAGQTAARNICTAIQNLLAAAGGPLSAAELASAWPALPVSTESHDEPLPEDEEQEG